MNEFSVIKTPSGGKVLIYGRYNNALAIVDYDGNVIKGQINEEEWIPLKNDRDSKFAWHGQYQIENGKMFGRIQPKMHARKSALT